MQAQKPIVFTTGKPINSRFLGTTLPGHRFVAYQRDNRAYVLDFSNPFTAATGIYHRRSIASSLRETLITEFSATDMTETKWNAGECVPSIWRPGRQSNDSIHMNNHNDPIARSD